MENGSELVVHIPIAEGGENPSFDATIPADVRYDTRLNWFEKLLYAEIRALTTKHGFCYAKNQYFMKVFDLQVRQIQRAIKHLEECNYIFVFKARNDVDGKIYRIIKIAGSQLPQKAKNQPEEKKASNMTRKTRQKCREKRVKNDTHENLIIDNNNNIYKRACARVTQTNKKSKNQFNNYSQRDYDWDAIEEALINKPLSEGKKEAGSG